MPWQLFCQTFSGFFSQPTSKTSFTWWTLSEFAWFPLCVADLMSFSSSSSQVSLIKICLFPLTWSVAVISRDSLFLSTYMLIFSLTLLVYFSTRHILFFISAALLSSRYHQKSKCLPSLWSKSSSGLV